MHWTQNYDPLHSGLLSTLVAAIPVILLLGLLASGRVRAPVAALIALAVAVLAAVFVFTPPEIAETGRTPWAGAVLAAVGYGAAFGLFPIGWVVFAAIFLYTLTVESGHFEIVKHSVISLSDDRRIQALLIAFCFGAFIEGAAGFGTPVAICSALLMGAGFRPVPAAGLALIANTAPVAFGSLGIPILTLADVTRPHADQLPTLTGLSTPEVWWQFQLSKMAGRQLPLFSLIIPAWLVVAMAGWRGLRGIWPALAVCGGVFAGVQFLVSNLVGPALVDIAGGLAALAALALLLRAWKPSTTWHFPDEEPTVRKLLPWSRSQVIGAWVPWILLSVFVFLWGQPRIKNFLDGGTAQKPGVLAGVGSFSVEVPRLHRAVWRDPPVVPSVRVEEAIYRFNWLSATGTSIVIASVLSAVWLGIPPARFLRTFVQTAARMRWPLVTIAAMLALAYVTRYSGMDGTLGLAFTRTGKAYPFFAAVLGWLGTALTGSDTSSNALFGSLQKITAENLVRSGVLPAGLTALQAVVLLATANSTGGVMGKMIDAQSIVVSAVATGQPGREGAILRFVFWHSVLLAALMGLLVMIQAYWLPAMIP